MSSPSAPAVIAALALFAAALLALPAAGEPAAGQSANGPPRVVATAAAIHPRNNLIAEIDVQLDSPGRVYVEYRSPAGALRPAAAMRSAITPAAARTHRVPLARLHPQTSYRYTVAPVAKDAAAEDSDAAAGSDAGAAARGAFRTRALPPALARLRIDAAGEPTAELVLIDLQDNPDSYFLFLDRSGRIVWYHRNRPVVADPPTPLRAVRRKPNHNLVYWEGGPTGRFVNCCLREIDPTGRDVTRLVNNDIDKYAHHDLVVMPGRRVLYIAHEIVTIDDTERGGDARTRVLVDSLRLWDQKTHATQELWDARDHLSLAVRGLWSGDPKNWLNANSLALGVRGNVILSLANRNQIVSIAPDYRSIEWRLGGPESSYEFPDPADRFYFQHTVTELPNGNILLFDNGRGRPEAEGGEYSRALELALNTYELTAVKVWEYRHRPDLYAPSRSSAYRLPSGNTLINFETNDQDPPRVIVEADADGAAVWQAALRSPTIRNSYRAYPADSIMGERPVSR